MDRAALDAALEAGLPCGGWCPRGRRAEDGPIGDRYPLRESESPDPAQRTRWNVRDSDATLVVSRCGVASPGTALTLTCARALERPVCVVDPRERDAVARIRRWLADCGVRVLNVAGPRESQAPGIYGQARSLLGAVLAAPLGEPLVQPDGGTSTDPRRCR